MPCSLRRRAAALSSELGNELVQQRQFEPVPALLGALMPKRLELRREATPSVRVQTDRLGRDYKRVHGDVDTLCAVGCKFVTGDRQNAQAGIAADAVRELLI